MKTVFDKAVRDAFIQRVHALSEQNQALWGKMNVYQMVKHGIKWDEMVLDNKTYKRNFMGRLFGKMALRSILKDESPLRHSTPTMPEFVIKEKTGDLAEDTAKWASKIAQYENFETDHFIHPFFGKMTKEQIGHMAYKHIDHHLRQFGA